jgi:hypothetical protein
LLGDLFSFQHPCDLHRSLIAGKGINSGVSSKYCIGLAGSLIEMEKNDISHSISRRHRYVRHSWQYDVL